MEQKIFQSLMSLCEVLELRRINGQQLEGPEWLMLQSGLDCVRTQCQLYDMYAREYMEKHDASETPDPEVENTSKQEDGGCSGL